MRSLINAAIHAGNQSHVKGETMNAKHEFEGFTPGPWTFEYSDADESRCAYVVGPHPNHGTPVTLVSAANPGGKALANAALIAAAPDLLAERDRLAGEYARLREALESMMSSRDANMAEAAKLYILHDVLVSALQKLVDFDSGHYQKGSQVDKAYKSARAALARAALAAGKGEV